VSRKLVICEIQGRETGTMASFFQSAHRQSLNDRSPHKECEYGNRQHDQGSSGADTGPVDLSVGDEIIDGHRHGFGLWAGEDQGEEKLVPGKDKGDDGRGSDAVSHQGAEQLFSELDVLN